MNIKKETGPLHHVKCSLQMLEDQFLFLQIIGPLGLHEKGEYLV